MKLTNIVGDVSGIVRKLILSFFALILVNSIIIANANGLYVFENRWGTEGSGDGQFRFPVDVVRDSSKNIFVLENGNHRIQKFHISNPCPTGTTQITAGICFVTKWGTEGSGDGQFKHPAGMGIDSSGNLFVADAFNYRIQKFGNDGTFIRSWGMPGSENGQFLWPTDVAVAPDGNVFVIDEGNNRTQKFSNTGTFIRSWGTDGTGNGQFNWPQGIAVAPDGYVFVADSLNSRIQKFSNTGTFIRSWGTHAPGTGYEKFPYGIDVDSSGFVYVSLGFSNRIEKYSNTGTLVTAWGQAGTGSGQFKFPHGLDVATPGIVTFNQFVYVADHNNRTQVFTWKPDVHPGITELNNYTGNVTKPGITELNNYTGNVTKSDIDLGATRLDNDTHVVG